MAAELKDRVERLIASETVRKLVSRYSFLQAAGCYEEVLKMFALATEGVRVEVRGRGIWDGAEGIRKAVVLIPQQLDAEYDAAMRKRLPDVPLEPRSGRLLGAQLSSPVVQVAADGMTAKGLWTILGWETGLTAAGAPESFWRGARLGVDFIQEDREWKFWHFQTYPIFYTNYYKSWLETAKEPDLLPAYYEGAFAPDRPSSTAWPAREVPDGIWWDPRPPEPYSTFSETWSY